MRSVFFSSDHVKIFGCLGCLDFRELLLVVRLRGR